METSFLSQVFSGAWSIFLIIIFFGGSIFIHELGHYLAARWRGLKIERFSIGFPPKLWSFRRNGVEYVIGATPLGGYVTLPQLAEMQGIEGETESDVEALPPISYADKMIVSAAGAFFNVLFALALGCILWKVGIPTSEGMENNAIGYVVEEMVDAEGNRVPSPAKAAGLQVDDRVVEIDGKPIEKWSDIIQATITGKGRAEDGSPQAVFKVERGGELVELTVKPILVVDGVDTVRKVGIASAYSLWVEKIHPGSPAEGSPLRAGDRLLAINGIELSNPGVLGRVLRESPDSPIRIDYERDGTQMEPIEITPAPAQVTVEGDIRPHLGFSAREGEVPPLKPDPISQITHSFEITIDVLGALLSPKSDVGLGSLNGAPMIGYAIHRLSQQDIRRVLSVVLLINVNLAILNLLPIPVLDGGHMAFATIAAIRRRKLPTRIIQNTQMVFMVLLLSLMGYVIIKDVGRIRHDLQRETYLENPIFLTGPPAEGNPPPPAESGPGDRSAAPPPAGTGSAAAGN